MWFFSKVCRTVFLIASAVSPFFQFLLKTLLFLKSPLIIYMVYHLNVIKYICHAYLKGDKSFPWLVIQLLYFQCLSVSHSLSKNLPSNHHVVVYALSEKGKTMSMGDNTKQTCIIHMFLNVTLLKKIKIVTWSLNIER